MTEQEKFEAMFSDASVDKTKRHGRPDQYKDLTANLLWEGWQAAIASREPMQLAKAEELAHVTAWDYKHAQGSRPNFYIFDASTLEQLIRKVERYSWNRE